MGVRGPKPGDTGYRAPESLRTRFMRRTVITEDGCWIWQGPTVKKGYGRTVVGSRVDGTRHSVSVHRAAYEEIVGPLPDDLTLDHECENTACWNPDHLTPQTAVRNKQLAAERATTCRRGHPRTPENTYVEPKNGRRHCRVCERMRR